MSNKPIEPTLEEIELFMSCADTDDCGTIRDWLYSAFGSFLENGECFNGKHPLGNSGWEWQFGRAYCVAKGLIENRDFNNDAGELTDAEEQLVSNNEANGINMAVSIVENLFAQHKEGDDSE